MKLTSAEFAHGARIPSRLTCDGEDETPRLTIVDPPPGVQRFALVMEDSDSPKPNFTHWVMWNIPADKLDLTPDVLILLPQGRNDFGKVGYGGPCPHEGEHCYRFQLYALDGELNLAHGATKDEVRAAMDGHIIAETVLEGRYARQ